MDFKREGVAPPPPFFFLFLANHVLEDGPFRTILESPLLVEVVQCGSFLFFPPPPPPPSLARGQPSLIRLLCLLFFLERYKKEGDFPQLVGLPQPPTPLLFSFLMLCLRQSSITGLAPSFSNNLNTTFFFFSPPIPFRLPNLFMRLM